MAQSFYLPVPQVVKAKRSSCAPATSDVSEQRLWMGRDAGKVVVAGRRGGVEQRSVGVGVGVSRRSSAAFVDRGLVKSERHLGPSV